MKLGRRFHDLYQRWWSRGREIERLNGIIDSLSALAERKRVACVSLEKQKAKLQLRIEELIDSHVHHSMTQCQNEISALREENILRVLECGKAVKRAAQLEIENATLRRTLYGNKA